MANSVANYRTAASVGPRFVTAGIMLAVLAGWMKTNHEWAPTSPVAIVGVAALLAFLWGVTHMRVSEVAAAASRQTRASGLMALLGAVVLAGVGIWWTVEYKRDALGEIFGLFVFAVFAAASGVAMLRSDDADLDAGWKRVRAAQAPLGLAFAAAGALTLAYAIYLAFVQKVEVNFVPDLVIMMMASFATFFSGMYLATSAASQPNSDTLKIVFLVIGASLGILLLAEGAVRAFDWGSRIFTSSAMSGSEAWRFWTFAYTVAAGIWLIAASSGLVLSMIRDNADLRRFVGAFGAVSAAVLMLVFLALANVMYSIKDPYTLNWTKTRGLTDLSPSTKQLLATLDKNVEVFVLASPRSELGVNLKIFLANCQGASPKFVVDWVDPQRDGPKYKSLANRFPEIMRTPPLIPEEMGGKSENTGRGILVVYGPMSDDLKIPVPHAWIPDTRLEETRGEGGKTTTLFKGEPELMKEIDFLAKKREKRKLYFLQGDDELSIAATGMDRPRANPNVSLLKFGAGKFVEKLKKDNFEVAAVSFGLAPPDDKDKGTVYLAAETAGKKIELPDDCNTLIVAGPSLPVPQAGLDALERFMDRGGKMVVFLDVFTDRTFTKTNETGLEELLKKFGVVSPNEFVFRLPQRKDLQMFGQQTEDPTLVLAEAPEKPKSVLAKQFQEKGLAWSSPRVVKAGESKKYQVDPLLVVSADRCVIWVDDNPRSFVDLNRYTVDLLRSGRLKTMVARENVPVAVTVSESGGAKPRMVVFGDAEFIQNVDISLDPLGYDLARSSIEWLGERGFVGPSPKESSTFSLGRTADIQSMVFGAGWTMVILILIFGIGVWLVRRR